jgi:hypothetical protein
MFCDENSDHLNSLTQLRRQILHLENMPEIWKWPSVLIINIWNAWKVMVEPVPPLYEGMAPGVEPATLQVQPNVAVER